MMKKSKKSGQVQVTFNWLYVLIAGGAILLFFTNIVVKQKESAEKGLSVDVIDTLESIFNGSYVSDKTQHQIITSGLRDYVFSFECIDEMTEYGIAEQGAIKQDNLIPIFAPREIKTERLFLWSIPYRFPFPIINLLIATSENTKYYLLGINLSFFKA